MQTGDVQWSYAGLAARANAVAHDILAVASDSRPIGLLLGHDAPMLAGLLGALKSGKTYVLKVSDKFELVATNDLGSPILASPAIVDGNLLLRTRDALYCIGTK